MKFQRLLEPSGLPIREGVLGWVGAAAKDIFGQRQHLPREQWLPFRFVHQGDQAPDLDQNTADAHPIRVSGQAAEGRDVVVFACRVWPYYANAQVHLGVLTPDNALQGRKSGSPDAAFSIIALKVCNVSLW